VGGQERLDVLSRCLLNLARWKNRLERDFRLLVYLSHTHEQKVLEIPISGKLSTLQTEIDSTHILIELLAEPQKYNAEYQTISFKQLLESISQEATMFYLTPDGDLISKQDNIFEEEQNVCFILGSQHDLTEDQEEVLSNLDYIPISLGDKNYLASHVITLVCNHIYLLNIN
jgi:tRNA pseudouridine-54 N-methylase